MPPDVPLSARLAGVRVLLVEDDQDSREMLAMLLGFHGAEVVAAVGSARDALDALDRQVPDVLVSDISLPDENGYSLIAQVRARPAERGGQVPAVAVTGFAGEEDRARAMAAGFQAYLHTPVEAEDLVSAIARLVDRS